MDPESQKAWELANPGTKCLEYTNFEIPGLVNPLHGNLSTKGEFNEDEGNQATIHN